MSLSNISDSMVAQRVWGSTVGAVVSNVISQQEGPEFNSSILLGSLHVCLGCLRVLQSPWSKACLETFNQKTCN